MEKFQEMINGDTPVLVDFFAEWCGPCKMMHPVLEELKDMYGGQLHIVKVDIDKEQNQQLVNQHNVQAVPTFVLFKDGNIVWRYSGALTGQQMKVEIDKAL